ncbi:hypothetical protein QBC38DRAFT_446923 [Podospora fimiseda]|uniref:Uncharacterized protein n=1 Tax=Podospora fimiseda TaxID=252190 RepID=A0AAN7BI64_9PEZI|nr:hypothetical protein QBC38DRAFT_446923 [Podospora fimiseda]
MTPSSLWCLGRRCRRMGGRPSRDSGYLIGWDRIVKWWPNPSHGANFGTELVYDDGARVFREREFRSGEFGQEGQRQKRSRSIERKNFKTPAEATSDDSDAEDSEPEQMGVDQEMRIKKWRMSPP